MADYNLLSVKLRGTNTNVVSAGLAVVSVLDGPSSPVDFAIAGNGFDYDPDTDTVTLVATSGLSVPLTRVGDYFRWSVTPNDFGIEEVYPAVFNFTTTASLSCYVVVRRDLGSNEYTHFSSQSFAVTITRRPALAPNVGTGLVGAWDAYTLTGTVGDAKGTWEDFSPRDTDLTATDTARPTFQRTNEGRPFLRGDGSNDVMATSVADYGEACTVLLVARIMTADATQRGIVKIGGTNGLRIAFTNANIIAQSGSDQATATVPATGEWFVVVATKTAAGAVTLRLNDAAVVTQASTAAVTPGTITVFDTSDDAFAAVDVAELVVWDTVQSAAIQDNFRYSRIAKWGIRL